MFNGCELWTAAVLYNKNIKPSRISGGEVKWAGIWKFVIRSLVKLYARFKFGNLVPFFIPWNTLQNTRRKFVIYIPPTSLHYCTVNWIDFVEMIGGFLGEEWANFNFPRLYAMCTYVDILDFYFRSYNKKWTKINGLFYRISFASS